MIISMIGFPIKLMSIFRSTYPSSEKTTKTSAYLFSSVNDDNANVNQIHDPSQMSSHHVVCELNFNRRRKKRDLKNKKRKWGRKPENGAYNDLDFWVAFRLPYHPRKIILGG